MHSSKHSKTMTDHMKRRGLLSGASSVSRLPRLSLMRLLRCCVHPCHHRTSGSLPLLMQAVAPHPRAFPEGQYKPILLVLVAIADESSRYRYAST